MNDRQLLAYELARDLIGSKIGELSHQIGLEEAQATPNPERIEAWETQIVEYAREREELLPGDVVAVRQVIERYSRDSAAVEAILSSSAESG